MILFIYNEPLMQLFKGKGNVHYRMKAFKMTISCKIWL